MNQLHILHLYPNEMNIYGDRGNLITLQRRVEWHGYEPVINYHHPGKELPKKIDIILGGGGQDSAQIDVQKDILRIGPELHKLSERQVPMIMICGMYQLFCHRFVTQNQQEIKGISIFDAETIAGPKRMVGNLMIENKHFGTLVGFENHSGCTILAAGQDPLGHVLRGNGNNGQDKTEGACINNVFGTYLHGPFLPNNPKFADYLIKLAAENAFGGFRPLHIDDRLAQMASTGAKTRQY